MIRALLCVVGASAAGAAVACAPVAPAGASVHIANEEAIIIWDAASKTQHFIRRAAFDTNAKDFGFLVPTPAQPQLEEADDQAFKLLAKLTEPAIIRVPRDAKSESIKSVASAPAPTPVVVLERKVVAGLDAAVLEATHAEALEAWLKKNDYPSSPQLIEWMRPYIAAKWKITAFKIDGEGAAQAKPRPVRMSFAAEAPFFPYREPSAEASRGNRLLRVYVISDGRVDGAIGKEGRFGGETVWSDQISTDSFGELLKLVKLSPAAFQQPPLWLTELEDRSNPRPGVEELFFRRAVAQDTVKRPPIREREEVGKPWWFDLVAMVIGLAVMAGVLWLAYKICRWLWSIVAR